MTGRDDPFNPKIWSRQQFDNIFAGKLRNDIREQISCHHFKVSAAQLFNPSE